MALEKREIYIIQNLKVRFHNLSSTDHGKDNFIVTHRFSFKRESINLLHSLDERNEVFLCPSNYDQSSIENSRI
jgi:hypothetical protein